MEPHSSDERPASWSIRETVQQQVWPAGSPTRYRFDLLIWLGGGSAAAAQAPSVSSREHAKRFQHSACHPPFVGSHFALKSVDHEAVFVTLQDRQHVQAALPFEEPALSNRWVAFVPRASFGCLRLTALRALGRLVRCLRYFVTRLVGSACFASSCDWCDSSSSKRHVRFLVGLVVLPQVVVPLTKRVDVAGETAAVSLNLVKEPLAGMLMSVPLEGLTLTSADVVAGTGADRPF